MATGLTSKSTLIHPAEFGLDSLIPGDGRNLLEEAVLSGRALTVAATLDTKRLRNCLLEEGGGERRDTTVLSYAVATTR